MNDLVSFAVFTNNKELKKEAEKAHLFEVKKWEEVIKKGAKSGLIVD